MQGNDLETMDIERLKILRGSQGTVFGKNTSGGAVNIVTRQPDLADFSGRVQLTGGSRNRSGALGSLNIPLASQLIDKNSRFVYAPKTSITVAAQYTTSWTNLFEVTGRVDYAYKSAIDYDVANSPLNRQKAYGLLNARLTFEHQINGLSLSLFGTNLTDKRYIVGGFDDADTPNPGLGFAFVDMAPPREYGVSAQWRF
jgi:outer membrane receptor protein involved in Fe transport